MTSRNTCCWSVNSLPVRFRHLDRHRMPHSESLIQVVVDPGRCELEHWLCDIYKAFRHPRVFFRYFELVIVFMTGQSVTASRTWVWSGLDREALPHQGRAVRRVAQHECQRWRSPLRDALSTAEEFPTQLVRRCLTSPRLWRHCLKADANRSEQQGPNPWKYNNKNYGWKRSGQVEDRQRKTGFTSECWRHEKSLPVVQTRDSCA